MLCLFIRPYWAIVAVWALVTQGVSEGMSEKQNAMSVVSV
jgi:hypothetical protein